MIDLLFAEEAYEIIGICMEVHAELGAGFSEIVYKDALEYEFQKRNISFSRETIQHLIQGYHSIP